MSRPSDVWQRPALILSCPIHLILLALKTYLQVSVETCEQLDNGSFNQDPSITSKRDHSNKMQCAVDDRVE